MSQVPSLTGGAEDYPCLAVQLTRLDQIDIAELAAEWMAQVELFVEATGRNPSHLDSHHHFSYFTPEIFRIMLELARNYNCAIRFPYTKPDDEDIEGLPPALVPLMRKAGPALLAEFNPPHPDYFNSSFYATTVNETDLRRILADLQPGTTELMSHPAYVDDLLMSTSTYNSTRGVELALLTDPALKEFLKEQGIELTNFKGIK